MKKFICFLALCAIITPVFFTHFYQQNNNTEQCIAGRGCCSRHGGVCGCSYGRSKCCDGTLSPSCQCFRDDVKGLEI